MSTLAIVLIAVAAVIAVFILVGSLGARARYRRQAGTWAEHVAAADAALETARAADKGWDRDAMAAAVRQAIDSERPGWAYDDVMLTLVDDKPGTEEDRAHFVAVDDGGQEAHVVLARRGNDWSAEEFDWRGE